MYVNKHVYKAYIFSERNVLARKLTSKQGSCSKLPVPGGLGNSPDINHTPPCDD